MTDLSKLSLLDLKGIGEKRKEQLFQVGVLSVMDLLEYYPRDYVDERERTRISDLMLGEDTLIRARLISAPVNYHRGRMTITRARVADESGEIGVVWFNQPYLINNLKAGEVYLLRGRVKENLRHLQLSSPKVQKATGEMPGITPVYPLGGKLTQRIVGDSVQKALSMCRGEELEYLPLSYRQDLMEELEAFRQIHHPDSFEKKEEARRRLSFDELFVQQMALRMVKKESRAEDPLAALPGHPEKEAAFMKGLPFTLTGAQERTIQEIYADLSAPYAMNRLVQGDVGSGKTLVAFAAIYRAHLSGAQSAMMVPTEVLAHQHLEAAVRYLSPLGLKVACLTGSLSAKERRGILEGLKTGEIHLVIGTHALISDPVDYRRLGLVITDEQHRFGVRQRLKLSEKGERPNVLVMTATPIPRTLTMILYGDMEVSLIDEMPPGRKEIRTYSVDDSYQPRLHAFMRKQVEEGHQVYVICPRVEESDLADPAAENAESGEESGADDLKSAVSLYQYYRELVFPDLSVGLLHGKLKNDEKEKVMNAFAEGKVQILVSTTVVEVGVNVPNATLMIIQNAERFGLASLHQLRGRVGRGEADSYCVLVSDRKNELTQKRLKTLVDSSDGFYIAEEDLRLRGSGDIFGLRQHGLPDFKIADLYRDIPILKEAQALASLIMENDPELSGLEHRALRIKMERFMEKAIKGS